MKYKIIREELYETVMKAKEAGLIRLSAGNISVRTNDGLVAITPSSIKYDVLKPEDLIVVDLDGNIVDGDKKPSSETPMHTAILNHLPDVAAVCHTHSPYAITFAVAGIEVPTASVELFAVGAPIPVAPWACPGTPKAGEITVDVFKKNPGLKICLLRNHGLVAIGPSLEKAYEFAFDAEVGMQTYYQALQLGKPGLITKESQEEIRTVYA
jgi:ribulose-5-phosphate 4-epimerase/fuculose-1-phosphate aldolase